MTNQADSLKFAVLFTGLGVALFFRGVFTLFRTRLIENMPTSKVRSAAIGYAEFKGMATGPAPVVGPVTEKQMIWWTCEVWQKVRNKDGKYSSSLLYRSNSPNPLFLKDDTGRVLIDTFGAELDCPKKKLSRFQFWATRFDEALKRMRADHLVGRFSMFSSEVWIEEKSIPIDAPLYVLGEARRADEYQTLAKRTDLRRTFRDYIADAKRDPKEIARADENRDGQISQEEWDKFVELKRREFENAENSLSDRERSELLVVTASSENDQPFLITVGNEETILRKMKFGAVLALIVGLAGAYFGMRKTLGLPEGMWMFTAFAALIGFLISFASYKVTSGKWKRRVSS